MVGPSSTWGAACARAWGWLLIDAALRAPSNGRVNDCTADLYWMPVGAGTSRFQQTTLALWETIEAARCRRPRARLYHSALKLRLNGQSYTVELTPAPGSGSVPPAATGPVGFRGADRLRLFRYALQCLPGEALPDEQWAVGSPVRLSGDCTVLQRMFDLAPHVPTCVWGRRVRGTTEMWTSDSVIAWLLVRAGIETTALVPPRGGRAPGWLAGIQLARVASQQP